MGELSQNLSDKSRAVVGAITETKLLREYFQPLCTYSTDRKQLLH